MRTRLRISLLAWLVLVALCLYAAAALTSGQLTALKADILADPGLAAKPNTPDGALEIATAYNLLAAPEFWVYRTAVSKAEYVQSTSVDATTFDWTGAGFITRTQGERDAWRELFNSTGFANPSLASVRQAFADIFSGAVSPAPANRTHLAAMSRRKAKRGERLYATGVGSTASPGLMTFEGDITGQDVQLARELP